MNITNISIEFPKTISHYQANISFQNKEEKFQLLEVIAESISSIYADFLTSAWHSKERSKNLHLMFFDFPNKFPSTDSMEKFKINLKNKMIRKLNEEDEDYDFVYLSTDNAPEKLLDEVLRESGVSYEKYDLYKLFPKKTSTKIFSWSKLKKIEILMVP